MHKQDPIVSTARTILQMTLDAPDMLVEDRSFARILLKSLGTMPAEAVYHLLKAFLLRSEGLLYVGRYTHRAPLAEEQYSMSIAACHDYERRHNATG